MSAPAESSVCVACRIRPFAQKELLEGCEQSLSVLDDTTVLMGTDRPFTFDHCFGGTTSQESVYDKAVRPLVLQALSGYNATVLAYGQTGSGKTHTMLGNGAVSKLVTSPQAAVTVSEEAGVIPRVISDLFKGMEEKAKDTDFAVRVTFTELYNEELRDLLEAPAAGEPAKHVTIREDTEGNIVLNGLKEVEVTSPAETLAFLASGQRNRATGATKMNAVSSRSHAVFTIILEQTSKEALDDAVDGDPLAYKISKFHLVDLAGSERQKKTQAEGERLKEAVSINRGLLALGNVINALTESASSEAARHVPYRDSKLTRMLQDSLGGNSKTVMIACVSPADSNFEESLNTLRYAQRARSIVNKAVINTDPNAAQLTALRTQIRELQVALVQARGGVCGGNWTVPSTLVTTCGAPTSSAVLQAMQRVAELESVNAALRSEVVSLHKSQHDMRESMTMLSQRLLEAEIAKDVAHLAAESTVVNTEQVSLLESLRRRIHELESAVPSPLNETTLSQSDEMDNERQTAQQAMLSQVASISTDIKAKQELLDAYCKTDVEMESMRRNYEAVIVRLEEDLAKLQDERALLASKHKGRQATARTAPELQRLDDVENQIEVLRGKLREANRLLGMKAKSDEKAAKLAEEIASMKAAKVSLLRKLQDEAAKFRKMKADKERELCAVKRDQTKKEIEVRKATALNVKQQVVIQRKTEQITAMQAKMKDQADLAKWAAQRREERDAEKAKKVDAIRQTKVAMGMSLCAPAPTGKPGEIKPATNGGTDAAIVANDDQLAQAVDAALDVAGDALNDAMRASLRKEIVLRANLARSHQLLQSYIQQRRDVTKQCHNARAAEASEDEIEALQSRIAKLSCDISVLQGVITNMDRELKMPHQSQRWTQQITDLKVAKGVLTGMMACIGHLAESSVSAHSRVKQLAAEAAAEQTAASKKLIVAERQIQILERQAIRDHVEAEQRVLALLLTNTATASEIVDETTIPSVAELRSQLQTLSNKYEELAESELSHKPLPVPLRHVKPKASGLNVKAKRILLSDDETGDSEPEFASDGDDVEFSSDSDGEWMPLAKGKLPKGSKKRQLSPNRSKARISGSSVDSLESHATVRSETSTEEPAGAFCTCKGMCVRGCVCKTAGRHCDGSCGCKHAKCKNRAVVAKAPTVPKAKPFTIVADDTDDDVEFVPVDTKHVASQQAPPVAVDPENPVKPPPTKRFKLQPPQPAAVLQLSDADRCKLKALQLPAAVASFPVPL